MKRKPKWLQRAENPNPPKAKWRKKAYWYQVKNAIRRESRALGDGREFSSVEYYPDEWVGSWASFILPSAIDRTVVYDVMLRTAQHVMMEDLEDKIYRKVYDDAEGLPEDKVSWVPSEETGSKTYIMETDEQKLDIFDGRTRFEEMERRVDIELARLKENGGHEARTSVRFGKRLDWKGRTKVYAILAGPSITGSDINQWVRDFLAGGEKKSAGELVPQDKLIYDRWWREQCGAHMANPIWKDPTRKD